MPAARGVKRTASKATAATTSSTAPKNKKKRGAILLEIPTAPKKRGRVFTCGQGDVGQLGLGEDVLETSKFKQVTGLGDKIVDCCAGGMHTVALDSDGKVWTFGCNDEGALGRPTSNEKDEGTPATVQLPAKAVAISAGDSHSAALLDDGQVFAWGAFRDSHGSMGLVVRGREGKSCREPVLVALPEPVHAIASGGDHLAVLCTSGSVYTMGCGEQGQLGRLSQRSASRDARQGFSALLTPGKVTLKGGASRIWAGYHATFALDAQADKVFAWGLNNYGQLGITGENRKTALFSPMECSAFSNSTNWSSVACGQHHSLALDSAGQVYAIGRCEYGRLGLGERAGDAETLEPVPSLQDKRCVSIAAGTSNSFAVTATGEVLAWGMGSEGQLGTGACEDAAAPAPAPAPPARRVAAGGQHAVLLTDDPVSQKEDSPAPEKETAEQKADEEDEEPQVPEKKKPRGTKRQRKQDPTEQEDEVSSTSSAAVASASASASASAAAGDKPRKVNGDEKKESPMEVDETDNVEKKKEDQPATEEQKETPAEKEQPEPETKEESKPETTDTSSQETTDSDTKSQETEKSEEKSNDVEMTQAEPEVNGEPEKMETKTVELIPTATPLTTSA